MEAPKREPDYTATWKKVDEMMQCGHTRTLLRRREASNGAISVWRQCERCGKAVGTAIKRATITQREFDALTDWDIEIEAKFSQEWKKKFDKLWAAEKEKCNAEWWEFYQKYLESPEWKQKRETVIKRAAFICEGCGKATATDVHHLSYDMVGRVPFPIGRSMPELP
jgi:hypothetical protein